MSILAVDRLFILPLVGIFQSILIDIMREAGAFLAVRRISPPPLVQYRGIMTTEYVRVISTGQRLNVASISGYRLVTL